MLHTAAPPGTSQVIYSAPTGQPAQSAEAAEILPRLAKPGLAPVVRQLPWWLATHPAEKQGAEKLRHNTDDSASSAAAVPACRGLRRQSPMQDGAVGWPIVCEDGLLSLSVSTLFTEIVIPREIKILQLHEEVTSDDRRVTGDKVGTYICYAVMLTCRHTPSSD